MKKSLYLLMTSMLTATLSGCFGTGNTADPPANFAAAAGDGRVTLTWTPNTGVEYWIFSSTSAALTAYNWTGLPNAHGYPSVTTPFYICGLIDGTSYYFAANGRVNNGPGGTSSPTVSAVPHNAVTTGWTLNPISLVSNINGVGYTGLTTCSNSSTNSAAGSFAAVGAGGAIFTSSDGISWTSQTAPSGFSSNLNAVTGYAAYQNNSTTPGLRWIAVGDGGSSIYSLDGINWVTGGSTTQTLRAITQTAGTYFAVGDAGTIVSTSDGITWTTHTNTSYIANNLNGVTRGSIYVAVGDNGTILTSSDGGSNWVVPTTVPAGIAAISLRKVTAYVGVYGSIYVAVGNAGTVVTSIDGGATWVLQTAPTSSDLVGISVETRGVDTTTAVADASLGFISTAQFVAVDSVGNTYTSVNGYDWIAGGSTGAAMNALVSSGFGYVAAGNAGATAHAF